MLSFLLSQEWQWKVVFPLSLQISISTETHRQSPQVRANEEFDTPPFCDLLYFLFICLDVWGNGT